MSYLISKLKTNLFISERAVYQLPTPHFKRNQAGQVNVSITASNHIDQTFAERGFVPKTEVRTIEIENVLVDTGATTLCLPTALIDKLGLPVEGTTTLKTEAGMIETRLLKELNVTICGRNDTFKCLELPNIDQPLLGVIPLVLCHSNYDRLG